MKIATVNKQPNEKRRWGIDYTDALDPGDLIVGVTITEPTGDVSIVSAIVQGGLKIRFQVIGGVDGITYKLTSTITTTNTNEIIEDEIFVKVKEI